jgi:membrane-associated HD superfamily phosphohydrolase
MLVIYLGAIFYSGKDPYNDREFLQLFNALLIGVLAIIFFSVAEAASSEKKMVEKYILFLLSLVTIVVNGIALSAILFRITEMGITPNRLAVMGSNILILMNLLLVTFKLYQVVFRKGNIGSVGGQIAIFLPVYTLWTIFVTFVMPFIFHFK